MAVPLALLATVAATAGAVSALRTVKRRAAAAERRANAVRAREAARAELGVLDLEPDAVTGVYGVPRPGRVPVAEPDEAR